MGEQHDDDTEPATAVFTWDVRQGREREFERWAHGINEAASRYPGHQGATWLRAEGSRHRYYTVVNFSDQRRLDRWLSSDERTEWTSKLDGVAAAEHGASTTGLETWFSLPGEAVPPPSRLKMVIVTFCAVYPLSILFQLLIVPPTQALPLPLRAAIFPLIMVPLLTVAIMPGLSRLLRRWLYPPHRTHRPATTD